MLVADNYTHEADDLGLQARRVKAVYPSLPVAVYLDAELASTPRTHLLPNRWQEQRVASVCHKGA